MITVTQVLDFLYDYIIAVVALVCLVIYVVYRKIKDRSTKKKAIAAIAPAVARERVQSGDDLAFAAFSPIKKEEKKDMMLEIRSLGDVMRQNSSEIDTNMQADFDKTRAQLQAIHARKEHIRVYALELSKIFDKYREREYYLTAMLTQMEEMLKQKRQEQQRPRQ